MTASTTQTTQIALQQSVPLNINACTLTQTQPNLIQITGNNGEPVMVIEQDGTVKYRLNGELKKVECDNELSQLFVSVICGISGFNFQDKNELYKTIAYNYRNGQLDNIFKK